jgi:hypothetical protein
MVSSPCKPLACNRLTDSSKGGESVWRPFKADDRLASTHTRLFEWSQPQELLLRNLISEIRTLKILFSIVSVVTNWVQALFDAKLV